MDHQDPFLQVQADVLSTLGTTRPLFSSYLRIRSLAKSPSNPELQQARSELETTLTDLTADLDDLVESVRAVEQDPYRFGLEIEEVSRRRKLVDDVGKEIEEMRAELVKVISNADHADAKASGLPNPADFDDHDADGHGDDYYAEMEQQRQMELMHEQDEQLDGVFRTVGNLRQQADDMGRELEEQAVMIGEIDTLADRVGGKLQNGMSRLKHIIRKNEGGYYHCIIQSALSAGLLTGKLDTMSSFCIGLLIFVLVLLLILVIAL
ncbi:t-SNARE [Aspergillus multicolor]|uniref:SNARE domain protein n=1 Tax=Aspergillus multicolor TaxID=41759 RepID=UPI003CCE1036